MKNYFFGVLAILLANGFSAFTAPQKQLTSDKVWFHVDDEGTIDNLVGKRGDMPPIAFGCPDEGSELCAKSFSIQDEEVVEVDPGEYNLATGVNEYTQADDFVYRLD